MRDIPFFATENGVASLTLKEIPYSKAAYIKIQDASEPEKLLEECVGFCKMAGAEKIYGSNHPIFENFPFHTQILQMVQLRERFSGTDAVLIPVAEHTLNQWREIYNNRMSNIPNFSYMSVYDGRELLRKGNGYFVYRGETLLGIGIASGEKIDAVISVLPGAGEDVICALNLALSGDRAILEVASVNEKAIRLYERMGFVKDCEVSCWFQLL